MADLQALIDAGMSPLDAASLAADLQRYETTGAPQLPFGLGGLGPAAVDAANYDYQTFTAPLSNKGNPTATLGNITNTFGLAPDQQIRLVDDTGKVIYSGTGYDAANEAIKLAQGLTDAGGRKAAWEIQTTPSATQIMWGAGSPQDGWKTIAQENKNKSVIGAVGDVLGDAALGALIGGPIGAAIAAGGSIAGVNVSDIAYPILGAMTPLGPIAGAAAGSAVSGAVQGRPIEDILLRSAITAGTAGLMKGTPIGKSISGSVGNALSDIGFKPIVGDILNQVAGSALPQAAADEIIVNAITGNLGTGAISGAVSSGVGSALNSLAPQIPTPAPPPAAPPPAADDLVVTAQPGALNNLGGSTFGSIAGSSIGNPMTGGGTNPVTGEQNDINVTAQPNTGVLNGLPSSIASGAAQTTLPEVGPIDTVEEPGFLERVKNSLGVSDYLKIASLAAGLLGGGNDGSGTRYTGVGGGLSPNFSAKLPTPSMPGASSNFAARPASEITTVNGQPRDWTKYGFGPEASFFSYVPQRGYAYGGDVSHDELSRSFAVEGPGTGRSDDIPAMLSDGEYVLDAETMALLGDGSPKAGAELMDQFRVNLRKHKGKKLAKGEFSVNAKKPERYLAGGRI